jgi:hypothetical protein
MLAIIPEHQTADLCGTMLTMLTFTILTIIDVYKCADTETVCSSPAQRLALAGR